MDVDLEYGAKPEYVGHDNILEPYSGLRSSEEPGQGRQISRPPSVLGSHFFDSELQPRIEASQRNSFFPWDHAGVSSSVAGAGFELPEGSDKAISNRFGASSKGSRRSGSLQPLIASPGFVEEPFELEVPPENTQAIDSQLSETNPINLERNSNNFLKYAKMQLQTMSSSSATLTFDDIVPKTASTPQVAATGFYHCLVLATKNLIGVTQEGPFSTIHLTIN